jgi:membrane-associated phospholipid phosphatase
MLDCTLDHYIPFIEVFIVPYILWFVFLGAAGFYFLFCESKSFVKMMYFGMAGMTLFLIISWIYPNGLALRPEVFPRQNIFIDLVRWIYSIDTATNVLPSIHVFNSVGVCCAIHYSDKLRRYPVIVKGSTILTVLIILSTMFVKQHSVVDVISGLALSYFMWELVYNNGVERLTTALQGYSETARRARYRKKRVPRWQIK